MTIRAVELKRAYRLLNHGPTVLVSAAHGGQRNVMAAAWAMPLDFDPPKVAVVLDKATWTRELIEASGSFALSVPVASQVDLVQALGTTSGREMPGQDKFAAFDVPSFAGAALDVPLIDGCVAWLECRLLPEPHTQTRYDLFLGEVIAAQADERAFSEGRWHFETAPDALRTLHHVAGGNFLAIGAALAAKPLPPR